MMDKHKPTLALYLFFLWLSGVVCGYVWAARAYGVFE